MPPGQSKVELYAALRRDAREGMSNRALERKYRVGWRTVQKALSSGWPQPREPYAPRRSKLDPFKPVIDQMLLADLDAPRKQRHTVLRIYRRLINEHAMDDVSYQVVRAYVAKRKPEIRVEAGRGPAQVFIEQSHLAGAEAEVDFGEVAVRLRGELVKCHLLCLRLSFSGKAVHRVFASGGQEAFFEGHEHAFRVLGGVPFGKIRLTKPRSRRCSASRGAGSRPTGGPHFGPTTASSRSTARRESRALTRKAASRARSAGFAATTSFPSLL